MRPTGLKLRHLNYLINTCHLTLNFAGVGDQELLLVLFLLTGAVNKQDRNI
jgi:hypothetical protein